MMAAPAFLLVMWCWWCAHGERTWRWRAFWLGLGLINVASGAVSLGVNV